jgi:cysteinyl-tRNA synthetase
MTHKESNNNSKLFGKFIRYIEDDFNTPQALELLINTAKSHDKVTDLKNMVNIFGLQY